MSKCENCIHYDVCYDQVEFGKPHDYLENGQCKYFKDKSLFVELPCVVGATLYVLSQMHDKRILPFINKYVCTSISIRKRSITVYHEMDGYIKIFKQTDFGKTVFLTKEEAEKKLKELKW